MGLCVASMIAAPWYILAVLKGGEGFIAKQLLFENIKRISGGSHMNTQSWYYYGPVFLQSFFPWSFLYICAFLYPGDGLRIYGTKRLSQSNLSKSQHLAHLWILGTLTLFTVASGKRSSYLLPLLPAVVISCTVFLTESLRRQAPVPVSTLNRLRILIGNAGIAFLCLVAVAVLFYLTDAYYLVSMKHQLVRRELYHSTTAYGGIFAIGVLLLLTGRVGSVLSQRQNLQLLYTGIWIGLIAILNLGISVKNNLKGFERQAQIINSMVPQDAPLYLVRRYRQEYFDPLMFYLNRSVTPIYPVNFQKVSHRATHSFYVLGLDDELRPILGETDRYRQITTLTPPIEEVSGSTDHKVSLWQHVTSLAGKPGI
jgi:hypothetical protein